MEKQFVLLCKLPSFFDEWVSDTVPRYDSNFTSKGRIESFYISVFSNSLSLSVRSFSSNAFCMSFLLFHIPHTITNKRRCICIFSLWVFLFVSFSSLTSSNLLIYSLSQIFFYQFILYIVSLLYIPHTFTNKRRCRHLYVQSVCLSVLLHLFSILLYPTVMHDFWSPWIQKSEFRTMWWTIGFNWVGTFQQKMVFLSHTKSKHFKLLRSKEIWNILCNSCLVVSHFLNGPSMPLFP